MRARVLIAAILLALLLPALPRAEPLQRVRSNGPGLEGTQPDPRCWIPTLLALGKQDFFLDKRSELELTPQQVSALLALQRVNKVAMRQVEERIAEAELRLYEALYQAPEPTSEIDWHLRWIAALRGELEALHFQYLLRAVNVLTHEQHENLFAPASFEQPCLAEPAPVAERALTLKLENTGWRQPSTNRQPRQSLSGCGSVPAVSIEAYLSYEEGRKAADRFIESAEQLNETAESTRSLDKEKARKLIAQMRPELWMIEWTSQALEPVLERSSQAKVGRLAERLRPEALANRMYELVPRVKEENIERDTLAEEARELKRLAKKWRASLDQAATTLCFGPPPVFLLY